jgi:hypothetical protein
MARKSDPKRRARMRALSPTKVRNKTKARKARSSRRRS